MKRKVFWCLGLMILLALVVSIQACPSKEKFERPEWKIGDQWTFKLKISKGNKSESSKMLRKVVGKEEFEETICYLTEGFSKAKIKEYFTLDLNTRTLIQDGKIQLKFTPEHPYYNWPLEIGKVWKGRYTAQGISRMEVVESEFKVVKKEKVKVPAGEFWTLKIVEGAHGLIYRERWYCPEAKNYVKQILYWKDGSVYTWVLLKYKV